MTENRLEDGTLNNRPTSPMDGVSGWEKNMNGNSVTSYKDETSRRRRGKKGESWAGRRKKVYGGVLAEGFCRKRKAYVKVVSLERP